jgi:hypothetical protein
MRTKACIVEVDLLVQAADVSCCSKQLFIASVLLNTENRNINKTMYKKTPSPARCNVYHKHHV